MSTNVLGLITAGVQRLQAEREEQAREQAERTQIKQILYRKSLDRWEQAVTNAIPDVFHPFIDWELASTSRSQSDIVNFRDVSIRVDFDGAMFAGQALMPIDIRLVRMAKHVGEEKTYYYAVYHYDVYRWYVYEPMDAEAVVCVDERMGYRTPVSDLARAFGLAAEYYDNKSEHDARCKAINDAKAYRCQQDEHVG